MKSTFTFILSLISLFIFGQNNYQIADSSKTWNTVSYGFLSFNVAQCSGTTSNKFSGETIIGNHTYLNVLESTDSLQTDWGQIKTFKRLQYLEELCASNLFTANFSLC